MTNIPLFVFNRAGRLKSCMACDAQRVTSNTLFARTKSPPGAQLPAGFFRENLRLAFWQHHAVDDVDHAVAGFDVGADHLRAVDEYFAVFDFNFQRLALYRGGG